MNTKLESYKQNKKPTEDDIVNQIETERADLTPDPEVTVPKGDEPAPVGGAAHDKSMKSLYDKGRKNRELTQRADAEGTPDVAKLQQLYAWAGQKPPDDTTPPDGLDLDTNKPDRFAEDRGEENETQYMERLRQEDEQRKAEQQGTQTDAGKKLPSSATNALQQNESESTVEVIVLGRRFSVPKQDVDDAGGTEAYQKSRSATIRLQRAATLEEQARALLTQGLSDQRQTGAQQDDPSKDGLSDADIDSLHAEMMDVVVDGSVEDMKEWIEKRLTHRSEAKPQAATPTTRSPEPQKKSESEIQRELKEAYEADRIEANTMMQTEYVDIMRDPELLGLAQQRFNVVKTNPNNEGRTQKEMAREAANFVRGLGKRLNGDTRAPNPIEVDRQTRIERKRQLPQSSRADSVAPQRGTSQENKVPTRKEHFNRLRRMAGHDIPPKQ